MSFDLDIKIYGIAYYISLDLFLIALFLHQVPSRITYAAAYFWIGRFVIDVCLFAGMGSIMSWYYYPFLLFLTVIGYSYGRVIHAAKS